MDAIITNSRYIYRNIYLCVCRQKAPN